MNWLYIIGVLIVIISIFVFIRKAVATHRLNALKPSIKAATNEFNSLCDVKRLFTEEEEKVQLWYSAEGAFNFA